MSESDQLRYYYKRERIESVREIQGMAWYLYA